MSVLSTPTTWLARTDMDGLKQNVPSSILRTDEDIPSLVKTTYPTGKRYKKRYEKIAELCNVALKYWDSTNRTAKNMLKTYLLRWEKYFLVANSSISSILIMDTETVAYTHRILWVLRIWKYSWPESQWQIWNDYWKIRLLQLNSKYLWGKHPTWGRYAAWKDPATIPRSQTETL